MLNDDFSDMLSAFIAEGVESLVVGAYPRRTMVSVDGLDLPVRGRDDLITNTLASGRPQDVADVKRLQADPRRHTS